MKMSMRFEGGEELAQVLSGLPRRVSTRLLREALREGGQPIQVRASSMAPRKPGAPDLADNIAVADARPPAGAQVAVAIGPTRDFYYGFMQEFGTAHHGAQPFLRPAFGSQVPKVLGIIGAALWRELAGRGIQRNASAPGGLSGSDAFTGGGRGLGAGNRQSSPRARTLTPLRTGGS